MSEYQITRIAPGFTAVDEGGVRWFVFEGEQNAILVDCGFGRGDIRACIAEITDKPITGVILTHADMDHTGACAAFDRIWLHPAEFDRFCEKNPELRDRLCPLWEPDEIRIGEYNLTIVLIPGHTPGSIALLENKKRFLIGGDSVQNGGIFMFSPGRSMESFIYSMDKLETILTGFDTVYASHGDLTVSPELIPELRQGAADVLAGKITGQDSGKPFPCKLYECGKVRFLYEP